MGQRRRRAGGEGGGRFLSGAAPTVLDLSDAEQVCTEPAPLEQVRRKYADLEPGDLLEVRSRITEHAFAVRAWCRKTGIQVLREQRNGDLHVLTLVKGT